MTHTLHRVGSPRSLQNDFVVMLMSSKKINREGSSPKFRRFLKMALDHGAVKIGDAGLGNEYHQGGVDKVIENVCERSVVVHAVFTDLAKVKKFLKTVKAADFGLSVIVSGLFDKVGEICHEVGIEMHTVDQSLGRWGRTDKLPPQDILEINTMCGHGMVAVNLIQDVINDVKKGACTPEEGAERLFRPCQCGVFNPHRTARLLREMCEEGDGSKD